MDSSMTRDEAPQGARVYSTYEEFLPAVVTLMRRSDNQFVRAVGNHVGDVSKSHTSWCAWCTDKHLDETLPCEEYERAFMLAMTWLISQVPA